MVHFDNGEMTNAVYRYHEKTKHHLYRYANQLPMDWANQPDPFRRYKGSTLYRLPVLGSDDVPESPDYEQLYGGLNVVRQPLSRTSLSRFLQYSFAISAWKQLGDTRWALRVNPSSGNLHPTECYMVLPAMEGLADRPGLYHFAPREFGLELRLECSTEAFTSLMAPFPRDALMMGLTSIHWREAWKYGERAFRYCQHDVGHAIGAVSVSAATLGWRTLLLEASADSTISRLLGLDREEDFVGAEREHPDCLVLVWQDDRGDPRPVGVPLFVEHSAVNLLAEGGWHGEANRLSPDDPVQWHIIDEVTRATERPSISVDARKVFPLTASGQCVEQPCDPHAPRSESETGPPSAGQIILQRRSAVAFDGKTAIPRDTFYKMLQRVVPPAITNGSQGPSVWNGWPWEPRVHLGLFVHLVNGIAPGLYALIRDEAKAEVVRQAMHAHFAWTKPPGCPQGLRLFLLQEGDARRLAAQVSCHQDIAGAGAFSLGMIAECEESVKVHGPWFYKRLFWEAGLIGQILYLEAEAAGIRATGIGCFFDDPVHQVFGLSGRAFQSLYHFTVGGPVEDGRLTTLPPYAHLS